MLTILVSIFFIQVIYVTCSTLRIILVLKAHRYLAAGLSTVEITIYMLGLQLVLHYVDHAVSLIVYALGFGLGILVGSLIEEKIALGYVVMKVITGDVQSTMASELRSNGYGVTTWVGQGRDGARLLLEVLSKRREQNKLYQTVMAIDPKAFIVTVEPARLHGGFMTKTINR